MSTVRTHQRGAFVLPIALMVLSATALMLLFTQRNLLLDLRITQRGYQHRLAYAAADSGLVIALKQLNHPQERMQWLADRQASGGYDTLLKTVLPMTLNADTTATVTIKPVSLGGADLRLKVQSMGCLDECRQGRAIVSQMLVMRGGIHQTPVALLTARQSLVVKDAVQLINQISTPRSLLLHAGGDLSYDPTVQRSLPPGQTPIRSEWSQDTVLARMNSDAFFTTWFGADKAFIRSHAKQLHCAGDCSRQIAALGSQVIWLEGDGTISQGVLGSVSAPVVLIVSGRIRITGDARIYGVVYSIAPQTELHLTTGRIEGAVIAENQLEVMGQGTYRYHPQVLQAAQTHLGVFVPAPDSWIDGE